MPQEAELEEPHLELVVSQLEEARDQTARHRAHNVWRRWIREDGWRRIGGQQLFWRTLDPGVSGFMIALLLSFGSLPLELVLWGIETPLGWLLAWLENTGGSLTIAFASVWMVSARGLNRLLLRRHPAMDEWSRLRKGWLSLRVGFPLLGFHVLAREQCRFRAREKSGQTSADSPPALRLTGRAHRVASWRKWELPNGWVLPWYLSSVGVVAWAVLWLAAQRGPGAWTGQLLVAACLHFTAFWARWTGGPLAPAYSSRGKGEARVRRIATGLQLLPHPAPFLALLVALSDPGTESRRSRSVVRAGFRTGRVVDRLPSWSRLSKALRKDWNGATWRSRWLWPAGTLRPADPGRASSRLRSLCRTIPCLLFVDGLALGRLAHGSVENPLLSPTLWEVAARLFLWLGLGATLGSGFMYLGGLAKVVLRLPIRFTADGLPQASALAALSWGGLVSGSVAGHHLASGELVQAGVWLALPMAALLGLLGFGLILKTPFERIPQADRFSIRGASGWILLPLLLATLGACLVAGEDLGRGVGRAFLAASTLSPLAHLAVLGLYGRWLLRPMANRQIEGRGWQRRGVVAVSLVLAVLLPGGGLAIPVWMAMRRRRTSRR